MKLRVEVRRAVWSAPAAALVVVASLGFATASCASSHGSPVTTSGAPVGPLRTGYNPAMCPRTATVDKAMKGHYSAAGTKAFGTGTLCYYSSGRGEFAFFVNIISDDPSFFQPTVATSVPHLGTWAFWEPGSSELFAYNGTEFVFVSWKSGSGPRPPEKAFIAMARSYLS